VKLLWRRNLNILKQILSALTTLSPYPRTQLDVHLNLVTTLVTLLLVRKPVHLDKRLSPLGSLAH
jgi:hypothetical protein